jgi:hypothetical protein
VPGFFYGKRSGVITQHRRMHDRNKGRNQSRVAGKLIYMKAHACLFWRALLRKLWYSISTVGLVLREFEFKIIYGRACTKIKC